MDSLNLPATVNRKQIQWAIVIGFAFVHLVALCAFIPWFFSWSAIIATFVGFYLFGTFGINMCFHRLLTHRSFRCPAWVEKALTILGVCNLQGTSIRWVAAHRKHHQESDHEPDPHSPLVDFFWSHIGWMLVSNKAVDTPEGMNNYAGDLCKIPFHLWISKTYHWLGIWFAHVAVIFLIGLGVGAIVASSPWQIAMAFVVWAVFVRTVIVWHVTWAINSVTHVWGYRNHDTDDNSRNNWLLGYFGMGEGWHNNHHAHQNSAKHGERWWEIDVTYIAIWLMSKIGLVSNIVKR